MPVLLDSISNLQKTGSPCARLSVWHIHAYVIGVQTALQMLNVAADEDVLELNEFAAHLHRKFGEFGTEYDAVWLRASSPENSARVFLEEWAAFLRDQKIVTAQKSRSQCEVGSIDLTAKLPNLEAKPHFYFATVDITYLRAWFDGVRFVSGYFGAVCVQPDLEAFEKWLRGQAAANSSCPWDMLLTLACSGDSCLAFARFFEELRRFMLINGRS